MEVDKNMMVLMMQRVMRQQPLFNFTEEEEESRTASSVT